VALVLACAVFCACGTKLKDFPKLDVPKYFVLDEDHVSVQTHGLLSDKWVEGLRAGRYMSVAESREGIYFLGEGASALFLRDQYAEQYLRDDTVAAVAENDLKYFPRCANPGGLWLPKPGVEKEPRIFWMLRNSPASGPLLYSATEDNLYYWDIAGDKSFIANLKIETAPPTQ
jgi:hypothetical protein